MTLPPVAHGPLLRRLLQERHVVVDAANVVGSRPDGWWHDRAGAATRLAEQLVTAMDAGVFGTDVVHLVLEGAARGAEVPDRERLRVVRAPADGDSAIVDLATTLAEAADTGVVVSVVTADRGLRDRLADRGVTDVVGPGSLLARLV